LGLVLDEPRENEVPTQVNGLDILISEEVRGVADKSLVDYTNTPYGDRFTISGGTAGC
jgi:Fe-S cluster assembly iron-binding protein IscA